MKLNPQRTFRIKLREFIDWMDGTGFDVGKYHISLFTAARAVVIAAFIFMVAVIVARLARRLIRRISGIDATQRLLSEKIATMVVWTLAFFIGVDALNISLTAFTVFSGAFGLAIGFGLQKTFGNLIAGLILLLDRSIKPGDVIAVAGAKDATFGEVKKIGVRAAIITTRDNREYLIPNEILMTSQVENWTHSSRQVAITVPVRLAHSSDLPTAIALFLDAVKALPRVLAEPGPSVQVSDLAHAAIELQIAVWITDPENGIAGVRSDVLTAIWRATRGHPQVKLAISGPTDIHLLESTGLDHLAEALAGRLSTDADPTGQPGG